MPLRPSVITPALLVVALSSACGGSPTGSPSDTPSSISPSSNATATSSPTASANPSASATPSASTSPSTSASPTATGLRRCAARGTLQVVLVSGTVGCAAAYAVTARYDFQGDKRQTVDGYVCETGNAMTRPTVLSCTDRRTRDEFSVDQR